ncbi:hypothetical protein SAMN05421823_103741 [Catalinimonas alkaloidigena]|uniref:Uncharacterized protein n=1 Tax=Catalinimonas alkaloidigena TaxID=1075417 RepID=A0A1G9FDC6_9BACT|nr:hypothetical protein SAMN05421823_103741 [Catalinimonas alkaloidigena]
MDNGFLMVNHTAKSANNPLVVIGLVLVFYLLRSVREGD